MSELEFISAEYELCYIIYVCMNQARENKPQCFFQTCCLAHFLPYTAHTQDAISITTFDITHCRPLAVHT